jgi:hypothetical protein
VLLTGDGNGVDIIDQAVSRRAQSLPPRFGRHLGAPLMRDLRLRQYLAGVRIADDDFA